MYVEVKIIMNLDFDLGHCRYLTTSSSSNVFVCSAISTITRWHSMACIDLFKVNSVICFHMYIEFQCCLVQFHSAFYFIYYFFSVSQPSFTRWPPTSSPTLNIALEEIHVVYCLQSKDRSTLKYECTHHNGQHLNQVYSGLLPIASHDHHYIIYATLFCKQNQLYVGYRNDQCIK